MADEVVTGGRDRKLQKRAQRGDGWTAKRRVIFLDHLAATCNVTQASRAAGMWNNSVYALRQRDPAFAAQWQAALAAGYAYRFDVPVRFAEDRIEVNRATFLAGEAVSVPLVEIREDAA